MVMNKTINPTSEEMCIKLQKKLRKVVKKFTIKTGLVLENNRIYVYLDDIVRVDFKLKKPGI